MAIIVPVKPNNISRLSDSLEYRFMMDDVGDGTSVKKYFRYRIMKGAVPITDWMVHSPLENKEFSVNIKSEASRNITTPLPGFDALNWSASGTPVPDMVGVFSIEYQEATKDLVTCAAPSIGDSVSTAEVTVVNSVENFWQDSSINTNDQVLSARPCQLTMSDKTEDWLYIWANQNVQVFFRGYRAGVEVATRSVTVTSGASGGVHRVQCGPAQVIKNFGVIDYYTYNVLGADYKVNVEYYDEDTSITFQEKQGGYSSISLKRLFLAGNMSDTRTRRYVPNQAAGKRPMRHNGGTSIVQKDATRIITVSKRIEAFSEIEEYLFQFVSSGSYIMKWKGKTVKALLVPGSYQFGTSESPSEFQCSIEILPVQIEPSHTES